MVKRTAIIVGAIFVASVVLFALWWRIQYGTADRLIAAIKHGDAKTVEAMLADEGLDVNCADWWGTTPVLQAMMSHEKAVFTRLLKRGANPNKCTRRGQCVMNQAAKDSDPFWLREALANGGDPDALNQGNPYSPNSTPIFYAIHERRSTNVALLIESGADVNHLDGFRRSPVQQACEFGLYESAVLLLEGGADPRLGVRSILDEFDDEDDETHVYPKDQLPSYRKAKEILIKRGFLREEPGP